jgi:hypothetical protein
MSMHDTVAAAAHYIWPVPLLTLCTNIHMRAMPFELIDTRHDESFLLLCAAAALREVHRSSRWEPMGRQFMTLFFLRGFLLKEHVLLAIQSKRTTCATSRSTRDS